MSGQLQEPDMFLSVLKPGEQLLWQGRPREAGLIKIVGRILLFIVFLAFIIIIGWGADLGKGTTLTTNRIILALILLLADLLLFYFATSMWLRKCRAMRYLITSKRILMKSWPFMGNWESYDLSRIVYLDSQRKPDGSGEIYFASFSPDDDTPWDPEDPERDFDGELPVLGNVDEVMMILQNAAGAPWTNSFR